MKHFAIGLLAGAKCTDVPKTKPACDHILEMLPPTQTWGKEYYTYTPEEKKGLQLDYRAAIKFLASQKNVDPERIGILAVGEGGSYAILEAGHDPAVQAVALVSSELTRPAKEILRDGVRT